MVSWLVILVKRRGVLFLAAILTLHCATLCVLFDLGTSSMMWGNWNGPSNDRSTGLTMCGSTPGVFLLVVRWCVRGFVCMILFEVGLFATIVGGAPLTL